MIIENETPANGSAAPPSPRPGAFPNCRAKKSGFRANTVLCLSKPPWPCPNRKITGENYLCLHPDGIAIAAHTLLTEQQPPPAQPRMEAIQPVPKIIHETQPSDA
jgi:hypothetical protein